MQRSIERYWDVTPERGFLPTVDPLARLTDASDRWALLPAGAASYLEGIAAEMPRLLESGRLRARLDALPTFDLSGLLAERARLDGRLIERAMLVYSYFASAYVYATYEEPASRIPAGVAVPLYHLSRAV